MTDTAMLRSPQKPAMPFLAVLLGIAMRTIVPFLDKELHH